MSDYEEEFCSKANKRKIMQKCNLKIRYLDTKYVSTLFDKLR